MKRVLLSLLVFAVFASPAIAASEKVLVITSGQVKQIPDADTPLCGAIGTCAGLAAAQSYTKSQRGTPATLTISTATFTPDFDAAQNIAFTLVHASCPCTLANPSGTPVAGQAGVIVVTQSATGSDTIGTWGSDYIAAGGTSTITLSTSASAKDVLSYYVIDATHIVLSVGALNATH